MLEKQIEAIIFFRNEPVGASELQKLLGASRSEIQKTIKNLQESYKDRGIVLVSDGESVSFGTNPELSQLIENIQKEEFSRELGRAGLETLAIILYRGPISRREIDQIRGVQSSFILRTLMIRGLIERSDVEGERSYGYKPTLKLLEYLGITKREDLPEFSTALERLEEFVQTEPKESNA
jgi:segregation and condensation protein B